MTIDNRVRFAKGVHAKRWSEITASEAYVEAVNAAMLTMLAGLNGDTAAANHYRLEGARQFAGILLNLTTERQDPRRDEAQNLKTNV